MTQQSPSPHLPFADREGLRDFPITHLVVGDPRALVLGRPAPRRSPGASDAVLAANVSPWLAVLRSVGRWSWHWQAGALASVIALFTATMLQPASGIPGGLPVRPAMPGPLGVRVVATAYVPASVAEATLAQPSARLAADQTAPSPLPFSLPTSLPATPHAGPPLPPSGTRAPAMHGKVTARKLPAAQVPVQEQPGPDEPPRPAVVLDEADARSRSAASAPSESLPAPPTVKSVTSPALPSRDRAVSKPNPDSARGLIAITPDSKLAVFTDPRTGLPQQFHIGDPLPGGDTIRAIDGEQGKVFTSAREYSLD